VRYFKYRPENLAPLATTTILPPSREITIVSPKLPVRFSTLIRSWRNFSNAEGSKILSFAGAEASRTYYQSVYVPEQLQEIIRGERKEWKGGNFRDVPSGIVSLRRACLVSVESAYCIVYSKATGHGRTYCLCHRGHGDVCVVVDVGGGDAGEIGPLQLARRADLIWRDCQNQV
jgi:hypothetical protein